MPYSPILQYIEALRCRYSELREGTVADYIPELSNADAESFGISVAMRDGYVYETGHTDRLFTIQSISKAFVYGLALQENGVDRVARKVGVEPSGDAFNAISLSSVGAPLNPMINAGAIAICGLIEGASAEVKANRILECLSVYAGRKLTIDHSVYRSESETGHRNRAIGWMLRNFEILERDPAPTLEAYFQQCSILVTSRDIALMGATLANDGINPITGARAIPSKYVSTVLSVMGTCGMYDFAGEWLHSVGLPAKSGVAGGILAVLPSQLGVGVFSPRLDSKGNSVRGIRVCKDLSRDLALHVFSVPSFPKSSLRVSYCGSQVTSKRRRSPVEAETLAREGKRIQVYELQGELVFSTAEPIVRLLSETAGGQYFILNFRSVISVDDVSIGLFSKLARALHAESKLLVFAAAKNFRPQLEHAGIDPISLIDSNDMALEYLEDQLLHGEFGNTDNAGKETRLADCDLCRDMSAESIEYLESRLERRRFNNGELIVRYGEKADQIFILLRGLVQVELSRNGQTVKRLDVFVPGMAFGEMAFIDGSPRSANVVALGPVECMVLGRELYSKLGEENPPVKFALLTNIAKSLSSSLRRVNTELSALQGA